MLCALGSELWALGAGAAAAASAAAEVAQVRRVWPGGENGVSVGV